MKTNNYETSLAKKLIKFILNNRISQKKIISVYLYGSSVIKGEFEKGKSDIDLLMIIDYDPKLVKKIYKLHLNFVKKFNQRIDLIIYGKDEIPQKDKVGYSLLQTPFLLDFQQYAILIFGKDVLKKIKLKDIKKSCVVLINHMRRGIRQLAANAGYLSQEDILRRMIGDRNESVIYLTENMNKTLFSQNEFAAYSAIISAKCKLIFNGFILAGKKEIIKRFLQIFKNESNNCKILKQVKSYKEKGKCKKKFIEDCLKFVENTAQDLEQGYKNETK